MQLSIQFIDHSERNFVAMTTLLVSYLVAISILTITPGLDTTLIIRTATLEGKSSAFHAALGISTGCIVWGLVVACGLGALFMASAMAFSVLKWVGAAYLAWLGLNMLFKPRHQLGQVTSNIPPSFALRQNAFFKGFLGNLLNPKIGVFYLSFLPQFIPAEAAAFSWIMGLVMLHVLIGTIWSMLLIWAMQPISRFLKQPKFVRGLDRVTGSIFLIFALKLVLSKR